MINTYRYLHKKGMKKFPSNGDITLLFKCAYCIYDNQREILKANNLLEMAEEILMKRIGFIVETSMT